MRTININKILSEPCNIRHSSCGSPMGDRDTNESESPLHLQKIKFIDGDYGPDGTYWGHTLGENLYCAFNGDDCAEYAPAMGSRIYVRAKSREEAIAAIVDMYPEVKFKMA